MTRHFTTLLACSLAIGSLTLATPASAQDLSVGYQWQRLSSDGEGTNMPIGFNVDVAKNVTNTLGVVGQFDWSHHHDEETILGTTAEHTANLATFGAGLRWKPANSAAGSAVPFVQALLGAARASSSCEVAGVGCGDGSDTNAMLQLGGGATFPLRGRTSGLAQFDYRRIFGDAGANSIRFVIGARLRLGN